MTVEFDFAANAVAPADAATVLVVRDGPEGPEVFFVKRRADARFMGGAFVFPGGRLDPGDLDPGVPCDLSPEEAARRLGEDDGARARGLFIAALRECLEEAGVLLATAPVPRDVVAALRAALAPRDAPPIGRVLAPHGVALRASALVPLARWVTPAVETRRFDARFFVARAPDDVDASHCEQETVASAWLTAREALARAHRREIVFAPPTYRTLEVLQNAARVDELLAMAPSTLPRLEPTVTQVDGTIHVVLPGDPDHPAPAPVMAHPSSAALVPRLATRFLYDDGTWVPSGR